MHEFLSLLLAMGTLPFCATRETCQNPIISIRLYHEESKHYLDKYAANNPMDWDSQPFPYRYFRGADVTKLEFFETKEYRPCRIPFSQLQAANDPEPENFKSLSFLMFHSFALSAEKQNGNSRWSLRVNPSSGNLHPTEVYIITDASKNWRIYHYDSEYHQLELRAFRALDKVASNGSFYVALSSIYWRESWVRCARTEDTYFLGIAAPQSRCQLL